MRELKLGEIKESPRSDITRQCFGWTRGAIFSLFFSYPVHYKLSDYLWKICLVSTTFFLFGHNFGSDSTNISLQRLPHSKSNLDLEVELLIYSLFYQMTRKVQSVFSIKGNLSCTSQQHPIGLAVKYSECPNFLTIASKMHCVFIMC